jgi:hypothetical protein
MTNEQIPTENWQQALAAGWKGCASVRMTLEQAQQGDVILAQYTRPREEDSPPPNYTDSIEIFVILEKPNEKFPRDCRALRIAQLSATGQLLGSVSWGTSTVPEGAELWLLGSCTGTGVQDARWSELSRNEDERV